jgi:hypothetical protein
VWPRYLAGAAPVVLVLFLLLSPVGALLLPAQAAAVEHVQGNGAPVFVLAFDEFPLRTLIDHNGAIDRELFPNLAALAGDATWYRNATTVHELTLQAIPAILTGRYPNGELTPPTVAEHPRSLFTLLAGSYDLEVFEHFQMCPSEACGGAAGDAGAGSPLEELLGDAGAVMRDRLFPEAQPLVAVHGWDAKTGQGDVERFDEMLASIRADDARNALYFQHLMLPHARFQYLPDGRRYNDPDPMFGMDPDDDYLSLTWSNEETATLALVRHRLQTMWVDTMVGRLLDRLREVGIYDDAVIVVTADHGVSLTAGAPHRALVDANAADILWVPLLVKAPQQRTGEVSDANVETIDVLPTIADLLDVDLPWDVDGVVAGTRPGREKRYFGEWNGRDRADGYTFTGRAEFATVMDGRHAAPSGVAPELRAFATGVGDALLGRDAERLAVDPTDARYALDDPTVWSDVDMDAAVVPAYVSGRLDVDGVGARVVAVSVDGRIAGVARTFAAGGDAHRFAMVIPPDFLRAGANDVAVYLVDDVGTSTPELHRIGL